MAAGIIILTLVVLIFANKATRRSAFAVVDAVRGKLLRSFVVYVAYFWCVLSAAQWVGLWSTRMVGESVAWLILSGITTFGKFVKVASEERFFRNYLLSLVEYGTLIALMINIVTFNLVVELLIGVISIMIVLLKEVARHKNALRAEQSLNGMLVFIGFGILTASAWSISTGWSSLDFEQIALSLAMAIWLPVAMLPFVAAMGVVSEYELLFLRLDYVSGSASPWLARLALLRELGVHRPRLIRGFSKGWHWELRQVDTWPRARSVVRKYKRSQLRNLCQLHWADVDRMARIATRAHGYYYSSVTRRGGVGRVLKIVRERQPGWEFMLYTAALEHMIANVEAWAQLKSRSRQALRAKSLSALEVSRWLADFSKEPVEVIKRLENALTRERSEAAFGQPGEDGDPRSIVYLAGAIAATYAELGDLTHRAELAIPSSEKLARSAALQGVAGLSTQIAEYAQRLEIQLAGLPERLTEGGPVELDMGLELSLSDAAEESWDQAFKHYGPVGP
ncbi:hypothetical protein [Janibacter sp. LM]|uniref:hypothetical protein n=1 Tax=Janibacter sp. LM TaxID=3144845 RepID=UPI0031F6711E